MPIQEERCGECGRQQNTCPECGGTHVTPFEPNAPLSPTKNVKTWIAEAEDGDEATFTHVCWDCPWEEDRTIRVEVSETLPSSEETLEGNPEPEQVLDENSTAEDL